MSVIYAGKAPVSRKAEAKGNPSSVDRHSASSQDRVSGSVSSSRPDVDSVMAEKKGICFDYAALMASMLRSQGVPVKLVVGYTSQGVYHAWINVWSEEGDCAMETTSESSVKFTYWLGRRKGANSSVSCALTLADRTVEYLVRLKSTSGHIHVTNKHKENDF